ncbi:TM2 domain-containing protein [Vibrio sp. RC27]
MSSVETAEPQSSSDKLVKGRNKIIAAVIAFFFGGIGAHRFYLGQKRSLIYLVFFWTCIPGIIAFFESIVFLFTSKEKWNAKYGNKPGPSKKFIVIMLAFFIVLFSITFLFGLPAYYEYLDEVAKIQ